MSELDELRRERDGWKRAAEECGERFSAATRTSIQASVDSLSSALELAKQRDAARAECDALSRQVIAALKDWRAARDELEALRAGVTVARGRWMRIAENRERMERDDSGAWAFRCAADEMGNLLAEDES